MARTDGNFTKLGTDILGVLFMLIYPVIIFAAIIMKAIQFAFVKKTVKRVTNEIAVVTGSGHGLGQQIALELAKVHCAVAVVDVNLQGAEQTVELIKAKYNVPAKAYKVDVTNYDQVVALNKSVCNDLGVPTILVNNAGVLINKNPLDPSAEDIQRMINVNLAAHFFTNKVFLPKMKELNKGHIVAIASATAQFPLVYNGVYSSTKVGVRNLMRVLRMELKIGQCNIHTTTVCPFFLNTNETVFKLVSQSYLHDLQPSLDGAQTARYIVDGMLRNELEILIPSQMQVLYRMLETLPFAWMDSLLIMLMGSQMKEGKIMELN